MSDARVRYGRQVRLPEIGEAGQERLCASEVTLQSVGADAREIEVAYLRAAGVKVRDADEGVGADEEATPSSKRGKASKATETDAMGVRDRAARDVAAGALAALMTMRAILGVGGEERTPPDAGARV
jgi:hypothetical protein